jgi:hypothetical protein
MENQSTEEVFAPIQEAVKELMTLIRENPKTKREIKQLANKLPDLVAQVIKICGNKNNPSSSEKATLVGDGLLQTGITVPSAVEILNDVRPPTYTSTESSCSKETLHEGQTPEGDNWKTVSKQHRRQREQQHHLSRTICQQPVLLQPQAQLLSTNSQQQAAIAPNQRRRVRQREAVIVRENGKSFADILRTLKQDVNLKDISVEIRSIRKAGDGVKINLKKGEPQASKLKAAISTALSTAEIKLQTATIAIVLKDLDAECDRKEIQEALEKEMNYKVGDINVLSLRPAFGGTQSATVRVPLKEGRELIKQGRVKVGWVSCRIREHFPPQRCYRCWETGHKAADCKGEDRSARCFQCHKTGHKADNCTSKENCGVCGVEGHRTNTRRCPLSK